MKAPLVASCLAVLVAVVHAQAPQPGWRTFVDSDRGLAFTAPEHYGAPVRGTDSGFRNRVAAYKFPSLSGVGGEAVLTAGFIDVDLQAVGGLYDAIARGVLQDTDVPVVVAALTPLTANNFCAVLGATNRAAGLKLPPRLLAAAERLDAMRNISPVVHRCTVTSGIAVFHKETTFQSATVSARQHLFGAVHFLGAPYSSFQVIRGLPSAPSADDLDTLARIVQSFRAAP
jgi:hypothetical protein